MSLAKLEPAKKVNTKDHSGNDNGFLIELFKDVHNVKTEVYLAATNPGMFKGYHLHRVRGARYICLKGKMKITLYQPGTKEKEEYILEADKPERLFIPRNIATGLLNIGNEIAWLVNYPDPAYDPSLKDEQVEYSEEELLQGVIK